MVNWSAYAVGKCTAIRLTESIDLEERAYNVRAFALQPGVITTDMAHKITASEDGAALAPRHNRDAARPYNRPFGCRSSPLL